jgi:hypothetical protein
MANIPNSKGYRTTGCGSSGASSSSPKPAQPTRHAQGNYGHVERSAPQREIPRHESNSGNNIWPWVIGFAIVLCIFPIQTLSVVAALIALAILFGKR